MRETSFIRSKSLQENTYYFLICLFIRQLIANDWGKSFSFWIFCGVAFDRTYVPVISRTFSWTVLEGLVAFPYQWVIKCSFKSSSEFRNRIRMGWKLPLFTDATVVLSSGWPLREMFYLPHNIMVLIIALSKFIFLSNIPCFCVEILKWQGFLWFLSTLN